MFSSLGPGGLSWWIYTVRQISEVLRPYELPERQPAKQPLSPEEQIFWSVLQFMDASDKWISKLHEDGQLQETLKLVFIPESGVNHLIFMHAWCEMTFICEDVQTFNLMLSILSKPTLRYWASCVHDYFKLPTSQDQNQNQDQDQSQSHSQSRFQLQKELSNWREQMIALQRRIIEKKTALKGTEDLPSKEELADPATVFACLCPGTLPPLSAEQSEELYGALLKVCTDFWDGLASPRPVGFTDPFQILTFVVLEARNVDFLRYLIETHAKARRAWYELLDFPEEDISLNTPEILRLLSLADYLELVETSET